MGKAECSVTGSMTMGVGMVVIVIMAGGVRAADPDPVQDYAVDAKSFVVRDIFKQGEILHDTGGVRAALTTANFPAITTQGITYVRVRIVACGCTLAHSHPRATEIMTLISGGPLQVASLTPRVCFLRKDNDIEAFKIGEAHIEIMYPGDVTLFPRGLLHFELNVGKEVADYLSALNSQDPGTLVTSNAYHPHFAI
ncbi:hypothetical protein L7F22_030916 [Adiantum nelumboides]|nr:hypothetical protein [Adiantum nelumboides]